MRLNKNLTMLFAFGIFLFHIKADWIQVTTTPAQANAVFALNTKEEDVFLGTLQGSAYRIRATSGSWVDCSWSNIDSTLPIAQIKYFSFNNNYTFCLTSAGIYRSDNNYLQWNLIYNKYAGYSIFCTQTSIFFASNSGILRSNDDGDTWENADTGLSDSANEYISDFALCNGFLLAASPIGVCRSNDNGRNWTISKQGLTRLGQNVSSLAVLGNLIIAGTGDGIFTSKDTGITWVQSNNGLPDASYVPNLISLNSVLVSAPWNLGIYISLDSAKTWYESNEGLSYKSVTALTHNQNTIIAGTAALGLFVADLNSLPISFKNQYLGHKLKSELIISFMKKTLTIDNIPLNGDYSFLIYSLSGSCVYSKIVQIHNNCVKVNFNKELPTLANGNYLIRLTSKSRLSKRYEFRLIFIR